MPAINTNISALKAQNALATNARAMTTAMEQLSNGTKVNSAKDDAAGLAIGTTMTSQIRGLNQAVRNANDGVNLLQTAEGAMVEQTNMLQRMRELAVQSVNATNSDSQRKYLHNEFRELTSQISDIGTQTKWNTSTVLTATTLTFQVGNTADTTFDVVIEATDNTTLGIDALAISNATDASAALSTIDTALDTINGQRSQIGATMNRLTYTADNLSNVSANLSASRSSIMDTDYATASSNLSKAQIIQQAATAMLAQANQQPQSVLALLK
jgi:flagellin